MANRLVSFIPIEFNVIGPVGGDDWPQPGAPSSGQVFNISLAPYNAPSSPADATSAIQAAISAARLVGGIVTQNNPPVWNPATKQMEGGTQYRVADLQCLDPGALTVTFWRLHLALLDDRASFTRILKFGNPTAWNAGNVGRAHVQECRFDGRQTAQEAGLWKGGFGREHQHAIFADENSRVTVRHTSFYNTCGDGLSMSHNCNVDGRYLFFKSCFRGGPVSNVGRVDFLIQDFICVDGDYGCGIDVELFTTHTGNMVLRRGLCQSDFDVAHNPVSDVGEGAIVLLEDVVFTMQRVSLVGAYGDGSFTFRRMEFRIGDGNGNDRSRIHRPRNMLFDDCDIYFTDATYKFHPFSAPPNDSVVADGATLGVVIHMFSESGKSIEFRRCRFHLEIVSGTHPIAGITVAGSNVGATVKLTEGCVFDSGIPPLNYGACTLQHDGTTSPANHWTGSGPVTNIAAPAAYLPYFGQYYGGAPFGGASAANLRLRRPTLPGDSFFFYADRTGVVDQIRMHWRISQDGYGAGDGGTYTIQIRNADPATRLPIVTGLPICEITGVNAPNSSATPGALSNVTYTFATVGALTVKQPYCIVWLNTHASPSSNYVSANIGLATAFKHINQAIDQTYQEPAGIDPVNVGTSIAAVSGWSPIRIDGTIKWHNWPALAEAGILHYGRFGGLYAQLRYSDGQWVGPGGAYGGGGSYKIAITTTAHLRERFLVTRATRVVTGVFLRVVRLNAGTGNLVFSLESGPASDAAGNGTTIEQVTIPAASVFDVGPSENLNNESGTSPIDFVPWTWVPFTQNRTLTLGQLYNARLFATSGSFSMWCTGKGDSSMQGPFGPSLTWAQWETQRQLEWTAWEDSRGLMVSTNSGSNWSFGTPRLAMILFKCVIS